jgi:hypothetical protein
VTNGHISQEDLTLHAMQSLSQQEDAAVRSHLAQCAACCADLASVAGDLALVALSVERTPLPAGARARFLDKIAGLPADASDPTHGFAIPIGRKAVRSRALWIPWVAVAALLVVAVLLDLQVQRLDANLKTEAERTAQLTATTAHAREVLDVLTAPTAQRVLLTAAKTPPAPSARAIYLAARGALIFQANNLTQVGQDKSYELWVIPADGSAPIPAGLFRPDAAGNASLVLPPLPVGIAAKAFGVTLEKASGSATPTAPILLAGAAPAAGE